MLHLDHASRQNLTIPNRTYIIRLIFAFRVFRLIKNILFIFFLGSSTASPLMQSNNPHSTTSPKLSPANISLTNSSQLTPPPDENDTNLNIDEDSSMGSKTPLANSTEDDERHSPSPPALQTSSLLQSSSNVTAGNGGAFTSLIQRNSTNFKSKSDFLSNFSSQLHQQPASSLHTVHHQSSPQQHALNHALAAQLFLQSPLMPQPSQWLYSQLYGNYNELPWLRTSLQTSSNTNANGFRLTGGNGSSVAGDLSAATNSPNEHFDHAIKRSVTLISHQDDDKETSTSPPVTSTKRTPSPDISNECISTTENNNTIHKAKSDSLKCRTPKQTDVWRPY